MTRVPRRWLIPAAAATCLGLATVAGPPARAAVRPQTGSSPAVLAHEIQVRSFWGLQHDLGHVQAVDSSVSASRRYGVPMAPQEVARLQSRLPVQTAATTLLHHLTSAQRTDFGTAWYDQAAGGVFHVSFTRNTASYAPGLLASFPYRGMLAVETVAVSQRQMQAAVAAITGYIEAHPGLKVTSVGEDDAHGRVVALLSPAFVAQAQTAFADLHLGVPVSFDTTPVTIAPTNTDAFTAPPTIAGLAIWRREPAPSTFVTICSSNFAARNAAGSRFMLTAGHCAFNGDNTTYPWSVGQAGIAAHPLGPITRLRFRSNYADDAALIPIAPVDGTAEIYDSGNVSNEQVASVGTFLDGDDITNAQSCNIGRSMNDSGQEYAYTYCGPVLGNNYTDTYAAHEGFPSVTLVHTRHSDVTVAPGYSGGAVYTPTNNYRGCGPVPTDGSICFREHAQGIISGGITGSSGYVTTIYTHIRYAMADFGVTVLTE